MCLGRDGVVVDKVDQAVGFAVLWHTDGCLIKQTSLRRVLLI